MRKNEKLNFEEFFWYNISCKFIELIARYTQKMAHSNTITNMRLLEFRLFITIHSLKRFKPT